MKKTIIVLSILVVFSFVLFGEVKIGVVHPMYIFQNTVKGKKIMSEMQAFAQKKDAVIKAIQNEIRSLTADLQKPLNASTKEEKTLRLQRKETELKRVFQDSRTEVQRMNMKKSNEFKKLIMPLVQNYCKEKGFTIVLDSSSNSIAYMVDSVDISKDIVKLVDEKVK